MSFGIMGAMDDEINLLKDLIPPLKIYNKGIIEITHGKFGDQDVFIAKSGVGKVNAAMCSQILISEFNIKKLLFTGVAGGINPDLNIGDIVLSEDAIQHDVDATALGCELGEIFFSDGLKVFRADPELLKISESIATPPAPMKRGRILTGDQFIANKDHLKIIGEKFGGDCVDMEGAAVGQVCTIHNIPFLLIRSISDKADEKAQIDFPKFLKESAQNSAIIVKHILNS